MPFLKYGDKLKWMREWNKNRVNHFRNNEKGNIRINLNGIKNRLYVCELCFGVGKTQFHEYTSDLKEVIELCKDCHIFILNDNFDDSKLFEL